MSDISIPSAEALSGMINTLKENPALLQSIAASLGMTNASEKEEKEAKEEKEENSFSEQNTIETSAMPAIPPEIMKALPTVLSLMNGNGKPKSKSEANREALLYALKPYLSKSRADAIEKIIRLSRIGDILSGL